MRSVKFSCVLPLFLYFVIRSHAFLLSSHTFPLCFAMRCFFVIRSYTFWLSSYTFPRTIWSNVSNSDTFLYVLCDSHANFAKSTIFYKFRSGFNGYGPCWALQRTTDRGLDILCQISLSIKFPCVLLQVLMRSRLPCQFPDLWDSV